MKIEIFTPKLEPEHLVELLRHIPDGAKYVIVQAPPRRDADLRPCQRPNTLEYVASVDNSVFIHYNHHPVNGASVKVT